MTSRRAAAHALNLYFAVLLNMFLSSEFCGGVFRVCCVRPVLSVIGILFISFSWCSTKTSSPLLSRSGEMDTCPSPDPDLSGKASSYSLFDMFFLSLDFCLPSNNLSV